MSHGIGRAALGILAAVVWWGQAGAATIYSNDFETAVGSEWSSTSGGTPISETPLGARHFLGEFVNDTVSLMLAGLPPHARLHVAFDLFVLRSWDGENPDFGGEAWSFAVRGDTPLITTNFNNVGGHLGFPLDQIQAFPDPLGEGVHLFRTGAAEVNTLGYPALIQDPFTGEIEVRCCFDSVYRLAFTFEHSAGSLVLDFSALGLQVLGEDVQREFDFFFPDESWGLDNVRVDAIPAPPALLLLGVGLAWAVARARRGCRSAS